MASSPASNKKLSVGTVVTAVIHLVMPAVFCMALWVLYKTLHHYHISDILNDLRQIPLRHLMAGGLLTVVNYWVLTTLDASAIRYAGSSLEYGKVALTSFIGYAFSHNVGLSWLSGGSIRYRLYGAWGLTGGEIAKVIAFCQVSVLIGFLLVSGVSFILGQAAVPSLAHLPAANLHLAGIILISPVLLYLGLVFWIRKPVNIREIEVPLPRGPLILAQILIPSIDWILAGSVAFMLLPHGPEVSFHHFLSIYLLSTMAGVISQVPGGLGVFESLMLIFLTPAVSASSVMGGLLAFRLIYYFSPLALAVVLLMCHEILQRKLHTKKVIQVPLQWFSSFVPEILSAIVFLCGCLLLLSGSTPGLGDRMGFLANTLPLTVIEFSHFFGSLVGFGMLILSWGLFHRIDASYPITITLFLLGIVFSLLKGFDYEEALVLGFFLMLLLPSKSLFYRKGSLVTGRFTLSWLISLFLALAAFIWLGLFSYKHVEYSHDLWWQFTFDGDAPRFMRAAVGVVGATFGLALFTLIRPKPPRFLPPDRLTLDSLVPIIESSHRTQANLALMGDKSILLNDSKTAFLMFGIEERSWVSMGDPTGTAGEIRELAWEFREMCDYYNGYPVFYQVIPENLHLYLDLGLTVFKLGEEARVRLPQFSLDGSSRKEFRHTLSRLDREGCTFEIIPRESIHARIEDLRLVSDSWLKTKATREKKFSLAFFSEDYLAHFPVAVVRKGEEILAFANLLEGGGREELSVDLMRYRPGSPNGIMEFLFLQIILWGKDSGYQWFNMGMAPLSGLEARPLAPLWNRIGAFLFRHGDQFYNFEGLRNYKNKFAPEWSPRYLACPGGGLVVPRILANLASLISGSVTGVVLK